MRSLLVASMLAGTLAVAADAGAESPYELDPVVDLPVIGLGLAGLSAAFIEVPPAACLPSCEPPQDLNALDRAALGHHSPTAHSVADGLVIGLVVSPALSDLVDSGGDGYLVDMVVHGEVLALTQGLTQLTKFAVRRSAPLIYDETVPLDERESRDASRSFWSGHAATAFAAATSYSVTYWLRHPRDPWRFVVLASSLSAATAVGMLKIHAGYHYPTDIAAGALAGASIGVLVPMLHTF
jgi:membrane-associated phospholipid phosphatase